jgi:hypothetical protein
MATRIPKVRHQVYRATSYSQGHREDVCEKSGSRPSDFTTYTSECCHGMSI